MKIRYPLIALSMLIASITSAQAQVDIDVQLPGISIGVDMPSYPELVQVPDYPVYYYPGSNSNYFFYDGLYWVYQRDHWYASSWYNGPWELTQPEYVPLYVLRVPVRYYVSPPVYFRVWSYDAPPRWGEYWGRDWEARHRGWDHWDHRAIPQPVPLPIYQRQYSGNRYPRAIEQQHAIRVENYRYQPHEFITQQRFQPQHNMPNTPNQRIEQNQRVDQNQRLAQPLQPQQSQRIDQNQRAEQQQQNQRFEQQQRVEQQQRAEQAQRVEHQQRAEQGQRVEQQQRAEQTQRAEQDRAEQQARSRSNQQMQPQPMKTNQPVQPAVPVQVQRPPNESRDNRGEPPRENKAEKKPEVERGRDNRNGEREPDRR
ncbi:hypothetical protein QN372_20155 [Undibacterium sp. RTI2.1]|uniref:hypothetical protein n=1 Tax=unclassified Undibacterium TaxID=2630295 RepID=UPI002B23072D|nr:MULTISPECIES: hypothetical protein [unclassified Undibacterium]MEB0033062.1 hypothetical protein [Undibacterium sp. RTI2.1]MEB0118423.1 hypothetical protein [Undibacterium sp. RTI2.2]